MIIWCKIQLKINNFFRSKMYESESEEDENVEDMMTIALTNKVKVEDNTKKNVLKKVPRIESLNIDSDEEIITDKMHTNLITRNKYIHLAL